MKAIDSLMRAEAVVVRRLPLRATGAERTISDKPDLGTGPSLSPIRHSRA